MTYVAHLRKEITQSVYPNICCLSKEILRENYEGSNTNCKLAGSNIHRQEANILDYETIVFGLWHVIYKLLIKDENLNNKRATKKIYKVRQTKNPKKNL